MPNFNYENPRNAFGASPETPEEQLARAVRGILTTKGPGGLTKEALLEQKFPEEFLSKWPDADSLIALAVRDFKEKFIYTYDDITEDAREYLSSGELTEDKSYEKLERLINRHIRVIFHPKNRGYVLMATNEDLLPEEYRRVVIETISQHFMDVLCRLVLAAGQVKNEGTAALLTTSIIGSCNAFVLQPSLCKLLYQHGAGKDPNYSEIQDYLNSCMLRSIYMNLGINKMF